MSETGLVQIIEGAILAADKPLTVASLGELFEEHERPDKVAIREALQSVAEHCEGRGFELQEVASGFRFQVRQSLSPWVARLWQERPQKYSRALLETLSLIAYRQPITRGEIEEIRGVAVSSNIVKTLHEREWIRVVGHRDVPGRPAMYATTRQFLDYFNLKNLDQLPALAEIRDLETLNAELGFTEPLPESLAKDVAGDGEQPADLDETQGLTVVGGTDYAESQEDLPSEDPDVQARLQYSFEAAESEMEVDAELEPPLSDESVLFTDIEQNTDFESEAATGFDPDLESENP
jgi:segregation and condensation protein B